MKPAAAMRAIAWVAAHALAAFGPQYTLRSCVVGQSGSCSDSFYLQCCLIAQLSHSTGDSMIAETPDAKQQRVSHLLTWSPMCPKRVIGQGPSSRHIKLDEVSSRERLEFSLAMLILFRCADRHGGGDHVQVIVDKRCCCTRGFHEYASSAGSTRPARATYGRDGIARGFRQRMRGDGCSKASVARWFSGRTAPNLLHASLYCRISANLTRLPGRLRRGRAGRGRENLPHDAHPEAVRARTP